MTHYYRHLTAEDRAAIMLMRANHSIRAIASSLRRAPGTVSRELTRHTVCLATDYEAGLAGYRARLARHRSRRRPSSILAESYSNWWTICCASTGLPTDSPQLKRIFPDNANHQVSHEAIHDALYMMPRGSLKKELIACLKQGNDKRRPRSRGKDRRG